MKTSKKFLATVLAMAMTIVLLAPMPTLNAADHKDSDNHSHGSSLFLNTKSAQEPTSSTKSYDQDHVHNSDIYPSAKSYDQDHIHTYSDISPSTMSLTQCIACRSTSNSICSECGYCENCDAQYGIPHCSKCDRGADCLSFQGINMCYQCDRCADCCECRNCDCDTVLIAACSSCRTVTNLCRDCGFCVNCDAQYGIPHCSECDRGADCLSFQGVNMCYQCDRCAECCICPGCDCDTVLIAACRSCGTVTNLCPGCGWCTDCDSGLGLRHCSECNWSSDCLRAQGVNMCPTCDACALCCQCPNCDCDTNFLGECFSCGQTTNICPGCGYCASCDSQFGILQCPECGWGEDCNGMRTNNSCGTCSLFIDVPSSSWFHSDINYVYTRNLMVGITSTRFEPNESTSRAMLVTMLWRFAGSPVIGDASFNDVERGSWYSAAIAWASANGIVMGDDYGRFSPHSNITREDTMVILDRYMQFAGIDSETTGNYSTFSDSHRISNYAIDSVQTLNRLGVVRGNPDNEISPQNTTTRAESATMLHRFVDLASN